MKDGNEEEVPASDLKVGDIIRIRPGDNVAADGDVLAKPDRTEKVHNVVTDGCIVRCVHVAKENDHVVPGLVRNIHVAEEDDHIMVDRALRIHTAEEAHGIVHRLALGNHDVAAELNRIIVSMRLRCGEQECRCQQEHREEASSHSDPHTEFYA